jgi:hypothetical protein
VVAIGEFGRTPRINAAAGRDHWGHVFSYVLAGAGIRTAQVYGSSDKDGAHPKTGKHEPQDLTATIFHLLGIPHDAIYPNIANTGRNVHISNGEPLDAILGEKPATMLRTKPTGDLAFVPEFSDALLLNTNFSDTVKKSQQSTLEPVPLHLAGSGKRLKGWQAFPLGDTGKGFDIGAALQQSISGKDPSKRKSHAVVGIMPATGRKAKIAQGDKAFLSQEIRNFRAGHYTFTIEAMAGGSSTEHFEQYFKPHFTCRMVIYRHSEATKNALLMKPAESIEFKPEFFEGPDLKTQKHVLAKLMDSRVPNVNFSVGLGFGIAVIIEKTSPGVLELPENFRAFIRVEDTSLVFTPRVRNDDVQV